ncbi:MAG TPA: NAD-dependent epimerase/dehydratase family protein [Vicinamibacterales bacterium]
MPNPLASDLDHVLAQTSGLWDALRGARVFMTGGTGFFGCWLLETFLWANDRLNLDASMVVLTRDRSAFARKIPHLAGHRAVTLREGDVRTLELADGAFSHVVHAGTDTSAPMNQADRLRVFETIVEGTRRTLELARRSGASRFLLTSTGGVYGRQPAGLTHVPEEFAGGPDPADAGHAGAEAKRAAETLCAVYADSTLRPAIARCFAFVGPYLPLDARFAAGSFIRDALQGSPIRVSGDGTPYRSYLYAADLAIWLWTILLRGQPMRPYNVGSAEAVTIEELARLVARTIAPAAPVVVARTAAAGSTAERYVPAVTRAHTELGLRQTVPLAEGIRRTADWHRAVSGHSPSRLA